MRGGMARALRDLSKVPGLRRGGLCRRHSGPLDGSVDPGAVLQGYVRKSASLGVEYLAAEAASISRSRGAVTGATLADGTSLIAPAVVNAAGAWCAPLAATAQVDLPVLPVMRTV